MNSIEATKQSLWLTRHTAVTEILVPSQGDVWADRGMGVAIRLARRLALPVRVLHLATGVETKADELTFSSSRPDSVVPEVQVQVSTIEEGSVPDGIVAEVGPGTLVVMSTDRAGGPGGGRSVAEALVRGTSQAVVLCGPRVEPADPVDSAVVAVDGSPMSESALDVATGLARGLGLSLWVIEVVDPATTAAVVDLRRQDEQVSESAYVRDIAGRLKNRAFEVGWEVIHGSDPAAGVSGFADDQRASLIVVGSHGRGGVARQALGSVAMALVADSAVPVVVAGTGRDVQPQITIGGAQREESV